MPDTTEKLKATMAEILDMYDIEEDSITKQENSTKVTVKTDLDIIIEEEDKKLETEFDIE